MSEWTNELHRLFGSLQSEALSLQVEWEREMWIDNLKYNVIDKIVKVTPSKEAIVFANINFKN